MALEPHVWTKYSTSGNNCVEVMLTDTEVIVRNSNHPDAGTLSFTHAEWDSHTQGQKLGVFDLPG
ncbi:DUF397 domain-containing protein [Kibdelosporangium phytohabitans]|uniref:DUF397 domain-containing protein n=1 Tax=Kibdelosporangium phytohabitans TaxID=860235 RepID=A0A0N9HXA0_9PSEU|nr:DUF397 domain-containing protein [Kibdelosporangium phytohabitans]ALG06516.1 hypothetical protein AOZ06_05870 [Kibdelosporangium phytohabitans]MBE1467696.1 hypothetical protein [Kibdelosporangium phytohabitans]